MPGKHFEQVFLEWEATQQSPTGLADEGMEGRGKIVAEGPVPRRKSAQKNEQSHRVKKSG